MMLRIASRMNKELDTDRITVDLHDEYYNMAEIIEKISVVWMWQNKR